MPVELKKQVHSAPSPPVALGLQATYKRQKLRTKASRTRGPPGGTSYPRRPRAPNDKAGPVFGILNIKYSKHKSANISYHRII